ncbi:hypothetical protein ACFLZP_00085 [Patescibacteria group bacterium]
MMIFSSLFNVVLAQGIKNIALSYPDDLINSGGIKILGKTLSVIIGVMYIIGAIACFLFMAIGALEWMNSGDDTQRIEAAREKVLHGLVALIILLSSLAILGFIGAIFKINFLAPVVPTLTSP